MHGIRHLITSFCWLLLVVASVFLFLSFPSLTELLLLQRHLMLCSTVLQKSINGLHFSRLGYSLSFLEWLNHWHGKWSHGTSCWIPYGPIVCSCHIIIFERHSLLWVLALCNAAADWNIKSGSIVHFPVYGHVQAQMAESWKSVQIIGNENVNPGQ